MGVSMSEAEHEIVNHEKNLQNPFQSGSQSQQPTVLTTTQPNVGPQVEFSVFWLLHMVSIS